VKDPNTSQDPDYEGPTGHEKKMHKTHFWGVPLKNRVHPKDDPEWEYIGAARWRLKRNADAASGGGT
jgi:hypothetical protein